MKHSIVSLDTVGGQGLVSSDQGWYVVSIDFDWNPIKLTDGVDAARWAISRPVEALALEYESLEDAARSIREKCLAAIGQPNANFSDVRHLIPRDVVHNLGSNV
jgi:hypothetical protein